MYVSEVVAHSLVCVCVFVGGDGVGDGVGEGMRGKSMRGKRSVCHVLLAPAASGLIIVLCLVTCHLCLFQLQQQMSLEHLKPEIG